MKLNMGCGLDKREGFVNIDINPKVNPDKICDIEKGLPFPDNTFDYILCNQILEHIQNLEFIMNEIERISKMGAIIHIEVPYYKAKEAFTHPNHKRFFTEDTFNHFNPRFRIISVTKERGKYILWHIHGLTVVLEVLKK